jgi:hypothetical protein
MKGHRTAVIGKKNGGIVGYTGHIYIPPQSSKSIRGCVGTCRTKYQADANQGSKENSKPVYGCSSGFYRIVDLRDPAI